MRKNRIMKQYNDFRMLAVDDDEIMTLTLQAYFKSSGYEVDIENDPEAAIERIRNNHYDILLLDFLMKPICGDEVVARIREFNTELYIILLTGHKSMAPPIKTIRELDIQGYYEKSDRFDQLELLIESCVKSIRQMRTIRNYKDGLAMILDSVPELYASHPVSEMLPPVIEQAVGIFNCEDAFIYLDFGVYGDKGGNAGCGSRQYFFGTDKFEADSALGAKYYDMACQASRSEGEKYKPQLMENGLLLPLSDSNGVLFGVLYAAVERQVRDDTMQLAKVFAKHVASAISDTCLRTIVERRNEELKQAYASLKESYLEIIKAIRIIVDAKDDYTRGHSDRVSHYSCLIAQEMGRSLEYCERVRVAGLFHDIGKLSTADDILLKDTKLTPREYEQIKQHPVKGKSILNAISFFADIAPIVEAHHERFDGKGYPNGIAGKNIPEEARIIAAADAFDAMTSDRRYRSSKTFEEAIEELKLCSGTQFDPDIVSAFLKVLENYESIRADMLWTHASPDSY